MSLWSHLVPVIPSCPCDSILCLQFRLVSAIPYCLWDPILSLWTHLVPIILSCPYNPIFVSRIPSYLYDPILFLWSHLVAVIPSCPCDPISFLWSHLFPNKTNPMCAACETECSCDHYKMFFVWETLKMMSVYLVVMLLPIWSTIYILRHSWSGLGTFFYTLAICHFFCH